MKKTGRRRVGWIAAGLIALPLLLAALFFGVRGICFPRPYREKLRGKDSSLLYAVMKAESNFRENALSAAGAVGVMQLLPTTAEYICRLSGIPFEPERLWEGEYNAQVGALYLDYLIKRFERPETAVAAYNAGEGTVREWLSEKRCSEDGKTLSFIPYPETQRYLKKVMKFRKIYLFFYHEST